MDTATSVYFVLLLLTMSTIGIHHREFCHIDETGGRRAKKEWEEDNRSVNTTSSSVTIQRSNVSEIGKANNARDAAVDGIFREFAIATLSDLLRIGMLVFNVRHIAQQNGVDIAILADDDIIQQARDFVQERHRQQRQRQQQNEDIIPQAPQFPQEPQKQWQQQQQPPRNIIARDEESTTSSLGSLGDAAGAQAAAAAAASNPDNVDGRMIGPIGSFSSSTSKRGTAEAVGEAGRLFQDANPDDTRMSDSVHNLEPIHIRNETAPAISPPRPVQRKQQVQHPVQDTSTIANNNGNGNKDEPSAVPAVAVANGDDVSGTTSTHTDNNGNGQDEENEDKKTSAKKRRVD